MLKQEVNSLFTDVLVVGAGPAGLSLAINLGKGNINTIVVDLKKREQIGYKPCGDALSPNSTQKLFELCGIKQPYGDEVCENLLTAYFKPTENLELSIPFRSQTIDRHKYGQRLLKTLADYPWIKFLPEHKVINTLIENNKVVGCEIRTPNGKKKNIFAKIVADCSGVGAVVRKNIPLPLSDKFPRKLKKEEIIVTYREILETAEPHPYQYEMRIEYHPEMPPPGYFWIFSKGERRVNIGLGWLINEKNRNYNPRTVLQQIKKKLFPNAKVIDSAGDTLPGRLPLYSMVTNGFIACGDAAALVNPISGEGHGPALISGYYASTVIKKAIDTGNFDEETLWPYNVKIWNIYGYEGALGIAVQKLLNAVPWDDFAYLFKSGIVSQKDVDTIMRSTSAKIPIASKVLKLARKPSLLFKLIKALMLSEKLKELAKNYPIEPTKFSKWKKKIQKVEIKKI